MTTIQLREEILKLTIQIEQAHLDPTTDSTQVALWRLKRDTYRTKLRKQLYSKDN